MRTRLLPLLVCSALVGCGGGEGPASGASTGGTVVVAVAGDAATIFPPQVFESVGAAVRDQLYDRLADMGDDLNTIGDKSFTPHLADRWEWSRDSLSIAFHLNPRARWHDGQPVRASDVRYSYSLNVGPALGSPMGDVLRDIDSVTVRDSLTPVFRFKHRAPNQFYLASALMLILPEHVFGKIRPDSLKQIAEQTRPTGSGRFRFGARSSGASLEIDADTGIYQGRPGLDRVICNCSADRPTFSSSCRPTNCT